MACVVTPQALGGRSGCPGPGDTVLDHARYYSEVLDWSVIPVRYRQKAARIKWGQYQETRPKGEEVQAWFRNGQTSNLAVILGPVSGNLCCRDYDVAGAYEEWAEGHPDLARRLPTVKTAKGYHVYFQADTGGIKYLGDGELRNSGGYCMLPPSVHPSGATYEWLIRPTTENLFVVDPIEADFWPGNKNVTQSTQEGKGEGCEEPLCALCNIPKDSLRPLCNIEVTEKIREAIDRTLPTKRNTRRSRIFTFVRELRSMPEYEDVAPRAFLPIVVREWHRCALPSIGTKVFEETAIDFLDGWERAKHKIGEGPIDQAYKQATTVDPPSVAMEMHPDHPQIQTLIALCRELQRRTNQGPFFLDCRTAGRLLEASHTQANRWLRLLVAEDILKLAARGSPRERLASTYRYLGD